MLGCFYKAIKLADAFLRPEHVTFSSPYMYPAARFAAWSVYTVAAGLVGTGLWVIAHECGHQAFSESKTINNTVGWFLHSAYALAACRVASSR
jgi:omega-6 fatty acid desaturase (delta-12 desaturase)